MPLGHEAKVAMFGQSSELPEYEEHKVSFKAPAGPVGWLIKHGLNSGQPIDLYIFDEDYRKLSKRFWVLGEAQISETDDAVYKVTSVNGGPFDQVEFLVAQGHFRPGGPQGDEPREVTYVTYLRSVPVDDPTVSL